MQATLTRHALPEDGLTVAFSGGMDSTVLLHAVHRLATAAGAPLTAIHVHHGLSPNADVWATHCADVCRRWKVPVTLEHVRVDAKRGQGVEAAARRERRSALTSNGDRWVILAHHADDQAETLLLNLARGCGVRGAAAMTERHGRFLRPLLGLPRSVLHQYAQDNGLSWIEDESNRNVRHTRNYLRACVVPQLRERFPQVARQFSAASARFAEASSLLDDLALLDLGSRTPDFPVEADLLAELPEARARNVVRSLLAWRGVQAPDDRRLTEFVRQVRTAARDRNPRLDLAGYSLERRRGMLRFHALDIGRGTQGREKLR